MRTRSKPTKPSKATEREEEASSTSARLATTVQNPPKPFILPEGISVEARVVTLSNPATSQPNRYLFCPEKGFYEFTKVAAPKNAPRSWFFSPCTSSSSPGVVPRSTEDSNLEPSAHFADGYVLQNADLFISTPIDALFLALPAIAPKAQAKKDQKQMFLSIDEHLDQLGESSRHLKYLLRNTKARSLIENRMGAICDSVDAGDEKMYRLNNDKLVTQLLSKTKRMVRNGLPPSMEEKFIRAALQAPILSVKREETVNVTEVFDDNTATVSQTEVPVTQTSTVSTTTTLESQSSVSSAVSFETTATSTSIAPPPGRNELKPRPAIDAPSSVMELLRLRTAFNFILSSYVPPHLRANLLSLLAAQPSIDFTPLDEHLAHLANLRTEAQALRSISENISRKRGGDDDDEAADVREGKRRKKEEEELKKKNESRGLKSLKKADISGMKKMSSFFTKAPAKKGK